MSTPNSLIDLSMLEWAIDDAERSVVVALKYNTKLVRYFKDAIFDDLGVVIDLEERLGFSPKKVLRLEKSRIRRAKDALALVRDGDATHPERTIVTAYNSLMDGRKRSAEVTEAVTKLYYDLAIEFEYEIR